VTKKVFLQLKLHSRVRRDSRVTGLFAITSIL